MQSIGGVCPCLTYFARETGSMRVKTYAREGICTRHRGQRPANTPHVGSYPRHPAAIATTDSVLVAIAHGTRSQLEKNVFYTDHIHSPHALPLFFSGHRGHPAGMPARAVWDAVGLSMPGLCPVDAVLGSLVAIPDPGGICGGGCGSGYWVSKESSMTSRCAVRGP